MTIDFKINIQPNNIQNETEHYDIQHRAPKLYNIRNKDTEPNDIWQNVTEQIDIYQNDTQ
jgi:hypothetical protein